MNRQKPRVLQQFEEQGYVVIKGLLDAQNDLKPVMEEYALLLDRLARQWYDEGKLASAYEDLPFGRQLSQVLGEAAAEPSSYQHLEISLPQTDVTETTPIHLGPAVFNLLRNPKLLDAVELFVGPEIYSNPVQHVRIKPPERMLPEDRSNISLLDRTVWHQDLGTVAEEADASNILTVWIPMTEATVDNGCLMVAPGSHKGGLETHCVIPILVPFEPILW